MLSRQPTMSYRIEGEQLDIDDILAQTAQTCLTGEARPELVVIMAGGLGQRMMPLTRDIPKPLLPIAERPMLEHIMCQMIRQGFGRFRLSVRHMADQIREHFGDGSQWNVEIGYVDEPEPLGTAGGLAFLDVAPEQPFVVANADLITDLDYRRVLEHHDETGALLTMCTREAMFQVPYGVVESLGERVLRVEEKPTQSVTISAGMYAVSPEVISRMKKGEVIDMPDLIQRLIEDGAHIASMPIADRWVDVGRRQTYQALLDHLSDLKEQPRS